MRRHRAGLVGRAAGAGGLLLALACGGGADTPLTAAVRAGDLSLAERLLVDGADPDAPDGSGRTALVWAAREGHVDLVAGLVYRGADPDLRDSGDRGWTPMMYAIHREEMDAVRALLNNDADPDVPGRDGWTPLMLAAAYGQDRMVELLLERGADPRARTADGVTALWLAVRGVPDLDHFTLGGCRPETVRPLVAAAPELRLEEDSWAVRLARLTRCGEVADMAVRPESGVAEGSS